ncbi:hypothetical protein GOODEAATRI_011436 [Goodea atripinnis]|uniref:Uncharacterized protein n=1 Tax=Goodea atripinnis TaxID=208336 RepID=A0ABV0NTV0_9TELE
MQKQNKEQSVPESNSLFVCMNLAIKLILILIEAELQRALAEIATSTRRPPAPSSARLSTEAGGGFPAHGLAPDQPSPLLPTPNPVPGPVPEGFMHEPPPHPDPVPGSVPEGFMDKPPCRRSQQSLRSTVGSPGPAAGRQISNF